MEEYPSRRIWRLVLALGLTSGVGAVVELPASAFAASSGINGNLLAISDLPAGWAVNNVSSSGSGGVLASRCLSGFKSRPKHWTRAVASYAKGGNVPVLDEELAQGPGEASRYASLNKALAKCKSVTFANSSGQTISGSIGAMSFPTVGTTSNAYSMRFSSHGTPLGFDVVMFRVAQYVGLVGYGDIGTPDVSQLQGFVEEAIAKAGQPPATTATTTATTTPAPVTTTPAPATTHSVAAPTTAPAPASPASIMLSGNGQTATQAFPVTGGLTIFTAQCGCQGNFVVEIDNSVGQMQDIPVNVIGSYSGSVAEGLPTGSYILKIDADASWSVGVTQPRHVAGAALPQNYSGSGQKVVGPFSAGSSVRVQAQNSGSSNFVVQVLSSTGGNEDIPINEIGAYSGSTISNGLSGSPYWMNIDSDGNWTVAVSNP